MYKNMPMPKPFSAEIVYFCNMSIVRAKKSLGQHFLRDQNIARKITDSLLPVTRDILEIGPGCTYPPSFRQSGIFGPGHRYRSGIDRLSASGIIGISGPDSIRRFSENRYPPILSGTFLCDRQSTLQYLIANFLPDH